MCRSTVLAGLALHFDSIIRQHDGAKAAYWQEFDNVKLSNSDNLTIGHCMTSAPTRSQKESAKKVVVIAGKKCPIWRSQSMWGM